MAKKLKRGAKEKPYLEKKSPLTMYVKNSAIERRGGVENCKKAGIKFLEEGD
jgi:hypothetical protein